MAMGMKLQPPLFLIFILAALATAILQFTPFGLISLVALGFLALVMVALNVPEAISMARASGRIGFFFSGLGLEILRGFAWGAGLGVGGVRQVVGT